MQNRRDFIKQASMLIAGGVVAPHLLSSCGGGAAAGPSKYLGLQLYSLREMVGDDGIRKTLEAVAKMGYTNLETADYRNGRFYGENPTDFKKMVEDLGMKLTSSHLMRNISGDRDADMAWWNTAVEAHSEAGMKYMIVPMAPLSGEDANFDNVKRYCDYFNNIALVTAGSSIQFGYHNHDFEFTNKIDDVPVFDIMLENTSPTHVTFQLDVYWVKMGGYDPVDYMKKYPNRFKILHIKDETAIGTRNTVDYQAVFNTAYEIGVKDWFVEVERYDGTPQEDVQKSADFLLNADFVK
jgi:sugar phosphate isomerase/epimerase